MSVSTPFLVLREARQKSVYINNDLIPQKLSFSSEADNPTHHATSVLLNDKQMDEGSSLYWYSTSARLLFCPTLPEDENVFQYLQKRIQVFDNALRSEKKFNNLLEASLSGEDLSNWEYRQVIAKIRCLRKATKLAIDNMGSITGRNWKWCCSETVAWTYVIGGAEYPTVSEHFNIKNI